MVSPQLPYIAPYHPGYAHPSPSGYHPQYPQLNGHVPPHTPPRMSGPSSSNATGRGGYHPGRGGPPGYQSYHHLPPQHFMHTSDIATPSPPPISPSYPHPHKSHPPQPPFTHQPAPPETSYQMGWSTEPLSPLPKQLSMLTPLPSQLSSSFQPPPPPLEPSEPASEHPPEPLAGSSPSLPLPLGTLTVPETEIISKAPAESPATIYAVWSRRPHDPSVAPAIIISPRACPPPKVIKEAIDVPTPPLTPVQPVVEGSPKDLLDIPSSDLGREALSVSPYNTGIPSSSATETTPACSTAPGTPMPGSPVSSNTSVSVSVSPGAKTMMTPLASPKVDSATPEEPAVVKEEPRSIPSVPPTKRSWASLLQSEGPSSPSARAPNALPVSSVVGFSVPGGKTSLKTPVSAGKRQDLLALLTSGPGPGSAPRIRPRGLVNSGNMCFANAVLQVLVYCQPFYRLFTELGKYLPSPVVASTPSKKSEGKTALVDAAIQFLKEFNPPSPKGKSRGQDHEDDDVDSFMPVCVYDAMKEKKRFDNMRGGHQEDAEEFLGFYLDTLEDELLHILDSLTPARSTKVASTERREEEEPRHDGWLEVGRKNKTVVTRTDKTTESPITRIFGGSFRSTLRVPSQKDSAVVETWRSLQLDIQREQVHTISEALKFNSSPQSVQVTSQARPGVTVEASQQVLIETLPQILVLHLKRFLYDTKVGGVVKIGKSISFTPELDIDPELMAAGRRLQRTKYKLFGVLYHHGLSASGGHYTLDVLHPNRDLNREGWIRIDDELVSDVLPKDVFSDVDADHRCPYLLFYQRLSSAWSPTSRI